MCEMQRKFMANLPFPYRTWSATVRRAPQCENMGTVTAWALQEHGHCLLFVTVGEQVGNDASQFVGPIMLNLLLKVR